MTEFNFNWDALVANPVGVVAKFLDARMLERKKMGPLRKKKDKNKKFGYGHSANRKCKNVGHSQVGGVYFRKKWFIWKWKCKKMLDVANLGTLSMSVTRTQKIDRYGKLGHLQIECK